MAEKGNRESPKEIREDILKRWHSLDMARQKYKDIWEELSEILMPNAGRFQSRRDSKDIRKQYEKIIDNTPLKARNIMAAGMQAGMASPARKWFTLQPLNPAYMQSQSAKMWFDQNTDLMFQLLGRSNIYQALHTIYQEMAVFGVGAAIIVPDFYTVTRAHQLTIGEYALGHDQNGDIDTLYREFEMTAGQLVKAFGLDNVSSAVKRSYEKNNQDEWFTVIHAIEPRMIRDGKKRDNKNMPFRSIYIERDTGDKDSVLSESGFPLFPAIIGRWDVTSTDVYGTSPGMQSKGDIKHLFFNQRRKMQGLDQQYNPSLQVPFSVQAINTLPGGVTRVQDGNNVGVRRMYEVNTDMSGLLEDINDIRNRINSAFFVDMFLMISQRIDRTMTATEVASLKEEKLMMIGPTYERMQHELYRKLIEIQFYFMNEVGLVPPPPEELQGMPMRVEFTSIMAQAMKLSEVNTVDRFLTSIANVAQIKPEVLDKVDADRFVDCYAEMLGVTPEILADDQVIQQIRQSRAQQQMAQQQQMEAMQQAQMARDLSQANMDGNNALTGLVNNFQGY